MGEASNFCNRWACQHACKEGRERTVRVTEESNTKTDPSSRLASRIIMPRMACISAQEEAARAEEARLAQEEADRKAAEEAARAEEARIAQENAQRAAARRELLTKTVVAVVIVAVLAVSGVVSIKKINAAKTASRGGRGGRGDRGGGGYTPRH